MGRGELRIYLGAAPGVGKTYTMLQEAHRRAARGTDVVIGFVETHSRPLTATMAEGLEVVPRATRTYRDTTFEEMDVDAVLARKPRVAVVDEFAHTNVPGSRNDKRWRDVQELLDAGITVLSTLNIQHLESLNDVVEQITGVPQRETVPDAIVRKANQVELIDMTPEALRRRMSHGNVYSADKVDAAMRRYFRVGNLTALRELALLWLADKVEAQLDRYRAEHGIATTWEARERVVVALTGGPEGATLIRRAARIAARGKDADLLAVHVSPNDGLVGADPALLTRQRTLVESLGGTYHHVLGDDIRAALLEFARGVNATQLVLGASRRGRIAQALSPGVGLGTTAESGSIDVHLVSHDQVGRGARSRTSSPLSVPRRVLGYALAVIGTVLFTVGFGWPREQESLHSVVLLILLDVTIVALIGGMGPAVVAAVGGFLLLNFFYTAPYHSLAVSQFESLLTLGVFLVVAVSVSLVVSTSARRTREAARAKAEAQTLSTVAGNVLRGSRPLTALLDQLRETFNLDSVTLLERNTDVPRMPEEQLPAGTWAFVAASGSPSCASPREGDVEVPVDDRVSLVLRGGALRAEDRRILEAFAAQAAVAWQQEQLAAEAAEAKPLAEADRMRTALLAAVSHDLRTPLAAAKAAVTSLRSTGVEFDPEDEAALLATADESLDRLARLVSNLLSMSRLQTGALGVSFQIVGIDDAVVASLDELGEPAAVVHTEIPADVPLVRADPGLLERIVVNLISNALRFSPPDSPPLITASATDDDVQLRVVDHGPGVPAEDAERIFVPFQRLGDQDNSVGVGLGLALSRGLTEAMRGSLEPEPTPGGGLTMCLTLPRSDTGALDDDEDAAQEAAAPAAVQDRAVPLREGPYVPYPCRSRVKEK